MIPWIYSETSLYTDLLLSGNKCKCQTYYRLQVLEFCFFDQINFPGFTCNCTYPWTNYSEKVTTSLRLPCLPRSYPYTTMFLPWPYYLLIICIQSYIYIYLFIQVMSYLDNNQLNSWGFPFIIFSEVLSLCWQNAQIFHTLIPE